MKARGVVTGVLLLFVVGSVAYMGIKEIAPEDSQTAVVQPGPAPAGVERPAAESETPGESSAATDAGPRAVIAYYFHGDKRCATCLKLEAYAQEALAQHFADDLKNGRLEWKVVNVNEPGNAHFIEDFQLVAKSVVLVALEGERQVESRNLGRIWDLVRDKPAYIEYIRKNTEELLKAGP
ncbi:MAG TPA: hypothetical protein HPP77_10840 [Candidatus Hydrogenedentes bacterium]|nr:hypothetical protein [Candidatus Hydrogenedentota bacterium]